MRPSPTSSIHSAFRLVTIDDLGRDLRYAARTLARSPGFTLAAALTLALGIGANTAVFSAVDAALLKPLAFTNPDRIVALFQADRRKHTTHDDVAPGNFIEWRTRSTVFAGVAAAEPYSLTIATPEGRERVGNWNVTQDFFAVLNATPIRGRLFDSGDFVPGNVQVVVLTYASWQQRFGADPGIIGRTITLQERPVTIIGVLPRNFAYLTNTARYEMFAPKVLDSIEVALRSSGWYHAVARLKPGVTVAQAEADLNRVAADLAREFPRTNADQGVTAVRLHDAMIGTAAQSLYLLLGAVGLVLLIACTNVANLLLARNARRRQELTVRIALGAGRRRIMQQMLTETFLLVLIGGIAGTGLASWGVGAIRQLSPDSIPRVDEMRVDARALIFTTVAVLLTSLICGLVPALRAHAGGARRGATGGAMSGARTAGSQREHRLRNAFVVVQVSFAVTLLVGAGLLVRSFAFVLQEDRGYASDHVLSATAFVWQYRPAERVQFAQRVIDRVRTLPGVKAAGAATSLPLAGAIGADRGGFTVEGQPSDGSPPPTAHITALTAGAFEALQLRLVRGRKFADTDDGAGASVAVISESMAKRYWRGEDPVGRRLSVGFYGAPTIRTVVGIIADVRQSSLESTPEPIILLPQAQTQAGGIAFLLRTDAPPRQLLPSLRKIVADLDPQLALTYITTLDEIVSDTLKARRFTLVLLGAFSAVALALAVIGVYGVISNGAAERAREIGVRIALGAQRTDILRLVIAQGVAPALAGVTVGVAGAFAFARVLQGMLYHVTPADPVTYAGVTLVMLSTAIAACYVPARRATRADPVASLRA
jgi:putative ABC transport system permease protein